MPEPAALPELFSCTRLSARLTVKACGARFMRVRSATPGQQDYDSACDRCPVGEHHARTGTLCPDTQIQTPATTATTITTTNKETTMGAPSEYTDQQKKAAVRRVLIDEQTQTEVAEALGVTSTTIRNWVKRWGTDVAGDAMSAAAAGGDVAGDAVVAAPKAKPKAARTGTQAGRHAARSEALAEAVLDAAETARAEARSMPDLLAVLDRDALGRLGAELSYAVVDIADKRARGAVADAAWVLTQASRG